MILKNLDYRKIEASNAAREEWNYFDNIENAAHFYDEEIDMIVVRCGFKDGNTVTFAVPYIAYLMSDTGKTIEAIRAREPDAPADGHYETMQDAASAAMKI